MDLSLLRMPLLPQVAVITRYPVSLASSQSEGMMFKRTGRLSSLCRAVGKSKDKDGGTPEPDLGCVFGEPNGALFGTLTAEITPDTVDFFVSDAEGDPDCPSEGFSSIDEALTAIREGKFVIAVDDEGRQNQGNLIMAASLVTTQALVFMFRHGSGLICVGMNEDDLERLKLPLMVNDRENEAYTAFAVTVDVKTGISSGVPAADRAKTIASLSSPDSRPEDFSRPGHVFPLKYTKGGVLKRVGHTEASVDLVKLAGLRPVSVLSGIMDPDDGSMASLPKLKLMSEKYGLPIVSLTDLIRYRRKREKLVERTVVSRLPTKWGLFRAYCYRSKLDGTEHIAIVKGDIGDGQDVLVRVHSECLTGDIFSSARCDCGDQLALAMQLIENAGRGVVVYLRGHEGRGIGLTHKLRAYNLQDEGHDTVEANIELGLSVDSREYGIGAQILGDMGVRTMRLMTNNPSKFIGLKGYGLAIIGRVPVTSPITEENKRYLETKRVKMGHIYGSDLPTADAAGMINQNLGNADETKKKQDQ